MILALSFSNLSFWLYAIYSQPKKSLLTAWVQNVNCVHFVQNAHSPSVTYYCELGVHFLFGELEELDWNILYSNNCCCVEIGSAIITLWTSCFCRYGTMLLGQVYMSLSIILKLAINTWWATNNKQQVLIVIIDIWLLGNIICFFAPVVTLFGFCFWWLALGSSLFVLPFALCWMLC
jgi:hypothetical protein